MDLLSRSVEDHRCWRKRSLGTHMLSVFFSETVRSNAITVSIIVAIISSKPRNERDTMHALSAYPPDTPPHTLQYCAVAGLTLAGRS